MSAKISTIRYCCMFLIIIAITPLAYSLDPKWQPLLDFRQQITNNKNTILFFTQHTPNSPQVRGSVILNSDNQFRIIYDEPYPLTFMGYPSKVVVYDYDMEHLTFITNDENPLDFLTSTPEQIEKYFEYIGSNIDSTTHKVALRHRKHDKLIELTLDKQTNLPLNITFYNSEGDARLVFYKSDAIAQLPQSIFDIDLHQEQPSIMIRKSQDLEALWQK